MTENVQRLAIGEVAARARMSASRIRYYEKQGLLPEPERTSGRRRYSEEVFGRRAPARAGCAEAARARRLIKRASSVRRLLKICSNCNCESIHECRMFEDRVLPRRERGGMTRAQGAGSHRTHRRLRSAG